MFTREELAGKTVKALKKMCVKKLGIPGMTKKNKGIIIQAILDKDGPAPVKTIKEEVKVVEEVVKVVEEVVKPISELNFFAKSQLTKPNARTGNKFTTTIYMACGATDGNFTVVGKTITESLESFGDILNADLKSTPLVNGDSVSRDYVLKEGDTVEFLKPAGSKG